METVLTLLTSSGIAPGSLAGLLAKGLLICLVGLFLCSELSLMAAAVRHRIAFGAVICLAALPLLSWSLVPWELEVLPRGYGDGFADPGGISRMLVLAYLMVALFLLARLCRDVLEVWRLSRGARVVGRHPLPRGLCCKSIRIAISDEIRTPVTCGWLRPQVLLPEAALAWSRDDLSMVLLHERAHIDRADWPVHLLARCVHVLYWPVPGLRQLLRQLSLSAEQACDDRVLASGASPSEYAAMLLRQARGNALPATVSLGRESELGIRVRYMVVEIADHSVLARGAVATFALSMGLAAPLAAMHLGDRPEVPVLPLVAWGAVGPALHATTPPGGAGRQPVDVSAVDALRPGPARPDRPLLVPYPPKLEWQQKPTIPPP